MVMVFMARPSLLTLVLVPLLALAPVAGAHHGDTPEQAEFPSPLPIHIYHHYLLVGQELQDLQNTYPDKVKVSVIGKSVLGLNIYAAEVSNFEGGQTPHDERYRIYFDGSIHSNEQLGMEAAMGIMRFLLDEYDTDPTAKFVVDNRRVFIVPLVNPDGNIRDSRQNVNSVDLNRNFPAGWAGPGSNARGPEPLSEPETQAVAAYLQEVRPHYGNSFHTGTLMLLHPWGNTETRSPDHDMYTNICAAIQADMDAATGTGEGRQEVPCGSVFETIYPASGTTVDYMYKEFGTVSFTFEVDHEQDLWVSLDDPRARLAETWVAVEHALLNVDRYGALLVLENVAPSELVGDAAARIQLTLTNVGLGPSNNTMATIRTVQTPLEIPVPDLAPGETTVVDLPIPEPIGEGEIFRLALAYNKTLHRGFIDQQAWRIGASNTEGNLVFEVLEEDGLLRGINHEGSFIPGFHVAVLLSAIGVAIGMRRRIA